MDNSTIERNVGDRHYLDLGRGESAVIEDPICETCKAPLEPIPPVGWVCLGERRHTPDRDRAGGSSAAPETN